MLYPVISIYSVSMHRTESFQRQWHESTKIQVQQTRWGFHAIGKELQQPLELQDLGIHSSKSKL